MAVWSKSELDHMKKNMDTMKRKDIAEHLGRDPKEVSNKISTLKAAERRNRPSKEDELKETINTLKRRLEEERVTSSNLRKKLDANEEFLKASLEEVDELKEKATDKEVEYCQDAVEQLKKENHEKEMFIIRLKDDLENKGNEAVELTGQLIERTKDLEKMSKGDWKNKYEKLEVSYCDTKLELEEVKAIAQSMERELEAFRFSMEVFNQGERLKQSERQNKALTSIFGSRTKGERLAEVTGLKDGDLGGVDVKSGN